MRISIKTKIITPTIILIILAIIFPTLFLSLQFRKNFEDWSGKMFSTTRKVLVTGLARDMLNSRHRNVQLTINELSKIPSIANIRIFDHAGKITYSIDTTEIGKSLSSFITENEGSFISNKSSVKVLSETKYASWGPINSKPGCVKCHPTKGPIAYLEVETFLSRSERFFRTGSVHIYFLAVVLIIILVLGFYLILQYFFGWPINRFIEALGAVEEGNLKVRLPATSNDEIGILEKHYNQMVEQIEASLEKIDQMHNDNIQRADKMVTLGELAAEMAHEVNNPAAIVMSRADFLAMEAKENQALSGFVEDLEVIIKQTESISKITNNILKYSKKLPTSYKNINVVKLLEESLNLLRPRLNKRKIRISGKFDHLSLMISADELQLQQVFTNLINNAIDAIGEEGSIYFSIYNEEKKIYIRIEDSGPGIKEENADNIFLPFFSTKVNTGGTGLGLYVVKNILSNFNATIRCDIDEDKGACFILTFNESS